MMKNSLIILGLLSTLVFGYLYFTKSEVKDYIGYKGDTFYGGSKNSHLMLNRITAEQTHIVWSTGNHTASLLPLGAVGPKKYTDRLDGIIQNTEIAKVLKDAVSEGISVILVIGDGMGPNHMSMSVYYNIANGSKTPTFFEKIMNEGISAFVINHPYGEIVGSSASTATSIACGVKTRVGMVGVDHNGFPAQSILDVAEKYGLSTGLITESTIIDATPTAFYGNSVTRYDEYNISTQLIRENDIEVVLAGGGAFFIPEGKLLSEMDGFEDINSSLDGMSSRKDSINLINEAKLKGYYLVNTKNELSNVNSKIKKLMGFFAADVMNATIDRDDENTGEPSLVDMTGKAIELLQNNPKGFFLMVESARIDFEAHDNDPGSVLKAVSECNDVVGIAYDYYRNNSNNTLVVFTADHETGGLAFTYASVPQAERKEITLPSGDLYTRTKSSILFEEFVKLANQKESIYKIFEEAKSANELFNLIKEKTEYDISEDDAEIVYSFVKMYHKGK